MVASLDCPKPRKMSAMPHTPKLTINTPITTAIMVLPSQFDEAFRIPRSMGPTCFAGGNRAAPKGIQDRIPQKGVTGLIKHHKVAAAPSQPWRGERIEAANARTLEGWCPGTLRY